MLKEFAAKKSVKLGKLLRDRGALGLELKKKDSDGPNPNSKSDDRNSSQVISRSHNPYSNHDTNLFT